MYRDPAILPSEITPEAIYQQRRQFLALGAAGALGLAGVAEAKPPGVATFGDLRPSPFSIADEPHTWQQITSYNNFYEFGMDKGDPARHGHHLKPQPWRVVIGGHCARGGSYLLEDLLRPHPLEERIYRLRCVEGWSMVIPWVAIPLADLLKRFEPTGDAKFVAFTTLHDPGQMPGQKSAVLDWPYREGLRIDEAMHPLTILAVGLYGRTLPNQNGAPLRLVVPWKYGFKSIKSIVAIDFVSEMPMTTWAASAPAEYGFYANVNPAVPHPRWSQARERRIGEWLKRDTLPFNGYASAVAHLYSGMDLRVNF
jgi:methionine sulfoxide reductase catalytic subunit